MVYINIFSIKIRIQVVYKCMIKKQKNKDLDRKNVKNIYYLSILRSFCLHTKEIFFIFVSYKTFHIETDVIIRHTINKSL